LLLDAVHVDTDQTAFRLTALPAIEQRNHVAAVHPQDDAPIASLGLLRLKSRSLTPLLVVCCHRDDEPRRHIRRPSTKQAGSITLHGANEAAVRGAIVRRRQQGCQEPAPIARHTSAV